MTSQLAVEQQSMHWCPIEPEEIKILPESEKKCLLAKVVIARRALDPNFKPLFGDKNCRIYKTITSHECHKSDHTELASHGQRFFEIITEALPTDTKREPSPHPFSDLKILEIQNFQLRNDKLPEGWTSDGFVITFPGIENLDLKMIGLYSIFVNSVQLAYFVFVVDIMPTTAEAAAIEETWLRCYSETGGWDDGWELKRVLLATKEDLGLAYLNDSVEKMELEDCEKQ